MQYLPFSVRLVSLGMCPLGSSMLSQIAKFLSFLKAECYPIAYKVKPITFFYTFLCTQLLSLSNSLWPPWTVAHQAPLSMGFSRQEYWRGVPFPSLKDLPDPGIELASLLSPALQVDSLPAEALRKPHLLIYYIIKNQLYPEIWRYWLTAHLMS